MRGPLSLVNGFCTLWSTHKNDFITYIIAARIPYLASGKLQREQSSLYPQNARGPELSSLSLRAGQDYVYENTQ